MSTNADFDAFFAEHQVPVVRALTLALGDRARAEDAAQEAFAKAHRQWRRVAMMDRPVAWVYVVALNKARRDRRRELEAPAPDILGEAPDPAAAVTVGVSVRAALDQLAPRQRLAVVLRYLADLQVDEVAAAMGCTVGTAKATLHTARARLRIELAPGEDDDGSSDRPEPAGDPSEPRPLVVTTSTTAVPPGLPTAPPDLPAPPTRVDRLVVPSLPTTSLPNEVGTR
jgi:RNA polymerase sigma-70 factor (ECF subfamily)